MSRFGGRYFDYGKLLDLRCRMATGDFKHTPKVQGLPGLDLGDETYKTYPAKKKPKKLKKVKIDIEDVSTGDL